MPTPKPILVGKFFKYGEQDWRYERGHWYILMWGWWPDSRGYPQYRWVHVEDHKVPKELKDVV